MDALIAAGDRVISGQAGLAIAAAERDGAAVTRIDGAEVVGGGDREVGARSGGLGRAETRDHERVGGGGTDRNPGLCSSDGGRSGVGRGQRLVAGSVQRGGKGMNAEVVAGEG